MTTNQEIVGSNPAGRTTKVCSSCKSEQPLSEFYYSKAKREYDYKCKTCWKSYRRKHYLDNKQYYVDKANAYSKKNYFEVNSEKVRELLERAGCADCDVSDWRVLEFDHLPEFEKVANVSALMRNSPWGKVQEEIDKCDVVCRNCHTIRTYERSGGWRNMAG